jgi:CRP-like cAMP-binding protein
MAILDDSPRSASVIARTEVTLFRFPSVPFQDLIEESNLAAFKLVQVR